MALPVGHGDAVLVTEEAVHCHRVVEGLPALGRDADCALLLVAPGWVRTDMGGANATFSIEESIPLVVDMVQANRGRPGLRYLDRFNKPLPW